MKRLLPTPWRIVSTETQDEKADVEMESAFRAKGLAKVYRMGTWFDDGVADLIDKLKKVGEYENTVFLFDVDHGYSVGVPAKTSHTAKGLRTPMFVPWPGQPDKIPAPRIDDLSYALDLHATALDYAGIEPPKDIASQTLRPKIADNHPERVQRMLVSWNRWDEISQPPSWKRQKSKVAFQFADYD